VKQKTEASSNFNAQSRKEQLPYIAIIDHPFIFLSANRWKLVIIPTNWFDYQRLTGINAEVK